jgi:geranylgeranyl diphosphate synthase type II
LDNDDYRRGKLSSHKKFGEAIAILTGDALLSLAFEIIGREMKGSEVTQKVLSILASSIGTRGMIGGQVIDIQSVGCSPNPSTLQYIYTHKTGALICASVKIGAIIGGAKDGELAVLSEYGMRIGFAFQLADDILDWKKDGKKSLTYPALYGLKATEEEKKRLIDEAIELLMDFGGEADPLRWIATFIGEGKW